MAKVFLVFLLVHLSAADPPATPTLTSSPEGSTQLSGTHVTLTCQTSSQGITEYKLFLNGREIQKKTSSGSFVALSSAGDFNNYTCRAVTSGISSLESPALSLRFINKPSTPHLQASNSRLVDGDHLTLTCGTTNPAVTQYKFYKGNNEVRSGTFINVYSVYKVRFSHRGPYTCKAFIGAISSDSSNSVTVTVLPKTPTLTANPSISYVQTGTEVTLTCNTASSGNVLYTFLINNFERLISPSATILVTSSVPIAVRNFTCKARISGATSVDSAPHMLSFLNNKVKLWITSMENFFGIHVSGDDVLCCDRDFDPSIFEPPQYRGRCPHRGTAACDHYFNVCGGEDTELDDCEWRGPVFDKIRAYNLTREISRREFTISSATQKKYFKISVDVYDQDDLSRDDFITTFTKDVAKEEFRQYCYPTTLNSYSRGKLLFRLKVVLRYGDDVECFPSPSSSSSCSS